LGELLSQSELRISRRAFARLGRTEAPQHNS